MADEFFQMTQRNSGNTDWDNLFPMGKFETASGTSTAITVTMPSLIDGTCKTFIAGVSNNSAATKINGKSLYKPNTTTAPNLIAGKAYTIWYNKSKDCFFIKASAEGNTIADHVLAGDTFSNDSDTGLVGTMDLKAKNIKEGVIYGGIEGILEEKQDFSNYLKSIGTLNKYMPLGFIQNEGLWVKSFEPNTSPNLKQESIMLLDENGNIVKEISIQNEHEYSKPLHISKSYILWNYKTSTNNFMFCITDKNGSVLYDLNINDEANEGSIHETAKCFCYHNNNSMYLYDFMGNSLSAYGLNNSIYLIAPISVNAKFLILGSQGRVYILDSNSLTEIMEIPTGISYIDYGFLQLLSNVFKNY